MGRRLWAFVSATSSKDVFIRTSPNAGQRTAKCHKAKRKTKNKSMTTPASIKLANDILQALLTKPLSTKALAAAVNTTIGRVYHHCRRLEAQNRLSRDREFRHNLYCVDCKDVVTSAKYHTCVDGRHDIRGFPTPYLVWQLVSTTANLSGTQSATP